MQNVREHEVELTEYALKKLKEIPEINILGNIPANDRLGVIAFNIGDLNNGLVSNILNNEGAIATRNGRFCAHPYLSFLLGRKDSEEVIQRLKSGEKFDIGGAVRLSFGIFNTIDEVDSVVNMLEVVAKRKWKANYEDNSTDFSCKELELNAS